MGDPERPPPVEQPEEEDQRQRQPDIGRVELVAESARVAARHLPGHLVAGPGLAHRRGRVVDEHLGDDPLLDLAAPVDGAEIDDPGPGVDEAGPELQRSVAVGFLSDLGSPEAIRPAPSDGEQGALRRLRRSGYSPVTV